MSDEEHMVVYDKLVQSLESLEQHQVGARVTVMSHSAGRYVEAVVGHYLPDSGCFRVKYRHGSRVQLLDTTQLEEGKQQYADEERRKARVRKVFGKAVPANAVASQRTSDLDEFVQAQKLQNFIIKLEELGVVELDDLQHVSDDELFAAGLNHIQVKRVQKHAAWEDLGPQKDLHAMQLQMFLQKLGLEHFQDSLVAKGYRDGQWLIDLNDHDLDELADGLEAKPVANTANATKKPEPARAGAGAGA